MSIVSSFAMLRFSVPAPLENQTVYPCAPDKSFFMNASLDGGRPKKAVNESISSREPPGPSISFRYRLPFSRDSGSAAKTLAYISAAGGF